MGRRGRSGYLDLRDLAKELEDLQSRADDEDDELDEFELARLEALKGLESELGDLGRYSRNEPTAIADSSFEDYARETASDLYGKEIDQARWPFDHIDWSAAADALQQDYRSFEFEDETYWVRSF